ENTAEPVEQLHLNHDNDLVDVAVQAADGRQDVLHTTAHHPFWNTSLDRWSDASNLSAGTRLFATDGYVVTVVAVRSVTGSRDMRDLTVADVHTYYVMAGNTPVLVHNDNVVPKWARDEIARIKAGDGTPRLDDDRNQKLYQGTESRRHAAK